jgi:hypothetical protein
MTRWLEKWNVIAIADSYKALPLADVVYGCDNRWWEVHRTCNDFVGERWACHEDNTQGDVFHNDKRQMAEEFGLNLVRGQPGDEFSFDPMFIRYGSNAGFQAINLALLFGCTNIVLVGFDMRHVNGQSHFFGDHPESLRRTSDLEYRGFVQHFECAAKALPGHVRIINATPGSALTCFPMMSLDEAVRSIPRPDGSRHCDRAKSHTLANRERAA